jgi:catechol 2,3-dioxygenase-like lactoylglutathione lyase family enzyme
MSYSFYTCGGGVVQVKGIIWVGTVTSNRRQTVDFFADRLGMEVTTDVTGFSRLRAENGDRLEVFEPAAADHEQLDGGTIAGLWVDDIEAAHRELTDGGVADVTDLERGPDGHRWFYFRAPDGNRYELCEHPRPRPR